MANPNPMAPIVRGSTKETLEDLYNSVNTTQPNAVLRDNLAGANARGMAWAVSKTAGTYNEFTDQINGNAGKGGLTGRDGAQLGFAIRQPVQVTRFTGDTSGNTGGLGYAKLGYDHSSEKYRG